jgi:hypothetical protein
MSGMQPPVTYGFGGNGLLISARSSICIMRNADGGITLLRDEKVPTPIGWLLPGDQPASAEPTETAPGMWRFGVGGPTLELEAGVGLDDVGGRFDTGLSDGPWTVLGVGFFIDLPDKVILLPGKKPRVDYELHLPRTEDHFIGFERYAGPTSRNPPRPGPGQQQVADVDLTSPERTVRYVEMAYVHEGAPWRQRFHLVPVDADRTMVVRSQATAERAEELFAAADEVAMSLTLA